ncbi:hypothetical protein DFA_12099 [Cavenderia fasciculata]|uniref:PROP1-like PPR domain-containing protein n=1 Tax=Cavenderia fasciculata TaxID=261658 RepID=F4QFT2_CACFS|nr:uncharacterized protein DFA_12099 [Cavenderia fasciculata]EGG14329.1 hypothetical protein DFA_12099 [Cavenderia fasciculata]|eukprot:XP_004351038.1 hypothetical protein DFA_12099 [Cavenderia fasciculata]
MSSSGKYVGLGPRDSSESPFPDTFLNWRELIYFRSWQASGLVPFVYYFLFIVGFILFISEIVVNTIAFKAGGFFLGLLYGIIQFIGIVFGGRIMAEVVLSIFDIRDNIYRTAAGSNNVISHQPQPNPYMSSSASSDQYNNAPKRLDYEIFKDKEMMLSRWTQSVVRCTSSASLYSSLQSISYCTTSPIKKIKSNVLPPPPPSSSTSEQPIIKKKSTYIKRSDQQAIDSIVKTRRRDAEYTSNDQKLLERSPEDRKLSQVDYFKKLSKLGRYEEASTLYKYLGTNKRTVFAYENLLLACAVSGKFNESWHVYNQMKKDSLKPSIYTLAHLLQTCTTARGISNERIGERVDKVIAECEKYDVAMTTTFLNIVMKALVYVGQHDKALEFVNNMKGAGVKPDIATYTTLVVAMSEEYKQRTGFLESKFGLLHTINTSHNSQELDELRSDGVKQIEKYTGIIKLLKKSNVKVDRYFINTVLHACKLTNNPQGVFQVYDTFKEMNYTKDIQSDTKTYDILISTCCYTNKIDKGLELFEDMINYNVRPDVGLINSLFRLVLRIASTKQENIYDVDVFMDRIIKYMERYQILPNKDTFQVLIPTYSKLQRFEKAYELLLEMKVLNIKPSIKDYTGLIVGIQGDFEKVMKIFRVIVSQRIKLTPEFISIILKIAKKKGSDENIEEIAKGIRELENQTLNKSI